MKLPSIFHGISSKLSKNVICCITSNTRGLIPFTIFEMLFPPLAFLCYTPHYKQFFFAKFCRAIPASKGPIYHGYFCSSCLSACQCHLENAVFKLVKKSSISSGTGFHFNEFLSYMKQGTNNSVQIPVLFGIDWRKTFKLTFLIAIHFCDHFLF